MFERGHGSGSADKSARHSGRLQHTDHTIVSMGISTRR
jgi:hypothetical protein